MPSSKGIHYIRKNFDSAAIVTALSAVALTDEAGHLEEEDHAILAALRRSNSVLQNAPLPEIQDYLRGLDETRFLGSSQRQGILHEMEFVRVENEDSDSVYASFFDATNHQVQIFSSLTNLRAKRGKHSSKQLMMLPM